MALLLVSAAQVQAQTPAAVPGEPGSVVVTAGNLSLDVTWEAPVSDGGDAITQYTVRHKLSSDPEVSVSWTEIAHTDTDLSTTVTGLVEWMSYDVQVSATNSVGEGDWSQVARDTPHRHIASLGAAGNNFASGIWSNGVTLWVADWISGVFAYSLDTGERDADKDIDMLGEADDTLPSGLWSDGTTLWMSAQTSRNPALNKVFAYDLMTGARDADKDIDTLVAAGVGEPFGIWSDGDTMWVVDAEPGSNYRNRIFAFQLSDGVYQPDKDFDDDTLHAAGVTEPRGIWSDGYTMWVSQPRDSRSLTPGKVYAFSMDTKQRVPSRDIETIDTDNHSPSSMWSDGTTMWALQHLGEIDSYELPEATKPAPPGLRVVSGDEVLTVLLTKPGDDGGAPVSEFEVEYKESMSTQWTALLSVSVGSDLMREIPGRVNGRSYDVRVASVNSAGTGIWLEASAIPSKEMDTLDSAGNDHPIGLWSDGTTMWVSDPSDDRIYAYDKVTTLRDSDKDIELVDVDNLDAAGLWSNGSLIWVLDDATNNLFFSKAFAYGLRDGARSRVDDVDGMLYAQQRLPYGLWSDGEVIWATSRDPSPKLFAYDLVREGRLPDRDFDTLGDAGVRAARGLWSDGETMWVGNDSGASSMIYAFSMATTQRVPSRDIDAAALGLTPPGGMWSDGTLLWVVGTKRVHVVALPPATVPQAPSGLVATPGNESLSVSWLTPGDDGGAAATDFAVQYKEADLTTWTTVPRNDPADLSVQIMGLTNGTSYNVRIAALNRVGPGPWAMVSGTPAVLVPDMPQNPVAVSGDGVLTLSWEAPGNLVDAPVDSYTVEYKAAAAGTWVPVPHNDSADLSVQIMGLTNGTSYDVRVAAMSIAGTGPVSEISAIPSQDFDTLVAADNDHPVGLWSNGTTMWVVDAGRLRIFAYDKVTTRRDPDKDIDMQAAGYRSFAGIWSDDTTMWVVINGLDDVDDEVLAYTLSTGARDSSSEINLVDANNEPFGIWSDGTTMWVSDWGDGDKIFAYDLSSGAHEPDKDFDTLDAAGIEVSDGITSDGSTMWVAETVLQGPSPNEGTMFAFSLDTKGRVPSRDIDITRDRGFIRGLWTDDGITIWGVAFPENRIEAYAAPAASVPKMPDDLQVSPGDTELEVRWAPPSDDGGTGVIEYHLRHRRRSPREQWAQVTSTDRSEMITEMITGLDNDAAYDVEVRAVNSVGEGPWIQDVGTPRAAAAAPGAPRSLVVSPGDGTGTLEATWSPPVSDGGAEVTSYHVWHRIVTDPEGAWIESTGASPFDITGLTNDMVYEVQVRAVNSVGEGAWAQTTATPEAPPDAPGAPGGPLDASPRNESLAVSWTAPADDGGDTILRYVVQYRTDSPQGAWLIAPRDDHSALAETIIGLTNDIAYDVRVAAVNSVGEGAWAEATATPEARRPGAPLNIRAVAEDTSLSISWDPPTDDGGSEVTGYVLQWRPVLLDMDAWTTPTRPDSAAATEQITGLAAGVEFVIEVAAVNVTGQGAWASTTARTPSARGGGGSVVVGGGGSVVVGGGGGNGTPAEVEPAGDAPVFNDVPADAYFADAVAWMIDNAITAGCEQDMFCPGESVTRAQFVVFLWRAAGRPADAMPGSETFDDVASGYFADQAIGWAVHTGVTLGCSGGPGDEPRYFCPTDPLTRAQIATLLYRYIAADLAPPASDGGFADVDAGSYYAAAVAWMVQHGITTGCSTEAFCPGDTTTRAQAAVFMHSIASNPESWGTEGIIRTPAGN